MWHLQAFSAAHFQWFTKDNFSFPVPDPCRTECGEQNPRAGNKLGTDPWTLLLSSSRGDPWAVCHLHNIWNFPENLSHPPAHGHLSWALNKALFPQLVFNLETMCWAESRRRNKKENRFWLRQVQCVKLSSQLQEDIKFWIFKKMHFNHVHPNRATRGSDRKYCSWLDKTER